MTDILNIVDRLELFTNGLGKGLLLVACYPSLIAGHKTLTMWSGI